MSKPQGSELLFKVIVIGDSSTGKSCLMQRYIKNQFKARHKPTVGVQFASKRIQMDEAYAVKLQIWDTAGQENFKSIVRNFYRNCSAIFLTYDITKKKTFCALNSWLKQARQNSPKNVMTVLIGSHLDMVEQDQNKRQVTKQEAQQWMIQNNINLFFETSSKNNVNVMEAFSQTANQLFLGYIQSKKASLLLFESMMQIPESAKLNAKYEDKILKNCC